MIDNAFEARLSRLEIATARFWKEQRMIEGLDPAKISGRINSLNMLAEITLGMRETIRNIGRSGVPNLMDYADNDRIKNAFKGNVHLGHLRNYILSIEGTAYEGRDFAPPYINEQDEFDEKERINV